MTIKFIDMFCGIGGFRYGLEACNGQYQKDSTASGCGDSVGNKGKQPNQSQKRGNYFSCVWSNDNDKYACQIYQKHFGEVCEQDIRTVDTSIIPEHNLLCAGFPCQSFSIAGQRGGFADIRGTLFQEICRVARAERTPYLLLENVKGLLSAPYTKAIQDWGEEDFDEDGEPTASALKKHKAISGTKGWVFLTILHSLWELGYICQWQVLNSKNYGVPQNRERVFLVGHLRGEPRPKVFPIGETDTAIGERDSESRQEVKVIDDVGRYRKAKQGDRVKDDGLSFTLDGIERIGVVLGNLSRYKTANRTPLKDGDDSWGVNTSGDCGVLIHTAFPNGARQYRDKSPTISTPSGGGHLPLVANALDADGYLRTGARPRDENGKPQLLPIGYRRIRRLTPLECERLQGFPDGWTEGISDTQRYKCLGNAVTVNVIEAIGKQLLESLND